MPSGGHARSGPAPDVNALRRDRKSDQLGWVMLEARTGDAPAWPLSESSKREDAMWARLWSTPQASQWEAHGWHDEVALYVRTFCEAAERDASPTVRTLVLRQMSGLGLSADGLSRLRWKLPSLEPAPVEAKPANGSRRTTARSRFETIIGGAA